MKVIFLDIDGPMTMGCYGGQPIKINEELEIGYGWIQEECDALTEIINKTGAKIVISSDWKKIYSTGQMGKIFEHYGIPNVIIGKTHEKKSKLSSTNVMDRAYQIADWLADNSTTVESWVSIDDMPLHVFYRDMHDHNGYNNIKPENHIWIEGDYNTLSTRLNEHTEKIIKFLNDNSRS